LPVLRNSKPRSLKVSIIIPRVWATPKNLARSLIFSGIVATFSKEKDVFHMMEFLASIEHSGFSMWVRESNSLLAYPLILFLHTVGMGVVAGISAFIALRVLGCGRDIPLADVKKIYPYMWYGFYLNTITGVILFVIDATTKIVDPDFYIKLVFIAAAVVLMYQMKVKVFGDPLLEKRPIQANGKILAFASIICWMGAITAGRLLAYVGPGVIGAQ
jgi:hypothetical protein